MTPTDYIALAAAVIFLTGYLILHVRYRQGAKDRARCDAWIAEMEAKGDWGW